MDDEEWQEPGWDRPDWHRADARLEIRIANLEKQLREERSRSLEWRNWFQSFATMATMFITIALAGVFDVSGHWADYGWLGRLIMFAVTYAGVSWMLLRMIKPPSR